MNKEEVRLRAWLTYIRDISFDRDGYTDAKNLGELVDELNGMAVDALNNIDCPIPYIVNGHVIEASND